MKQLKLSQNGRQLTATVKADKVIKPGNYITLLGEEGLWRIEEMFDVPEPKRGWHNDI